MARFKVDPKAWPAAAVEWRDPKKLKPHPNNPKNHTEEQIAFIAQKMKESGVWRALVIDERDTVLIGHGGRLASIKNGFKSVPVFVAKHPDGTPLAPHEKLAMVISDNQAGMLTGWNNEILRSGITALAEGGLDPFTLGFDEGSLAKVMKTPGSPSEFELLSDDGSAEHCCPKCGHRWNGPADAAPKEKPNGRAS